MKTVQINFIASSNKAKDTLFTNKLIDKASNAQVAKWLKTASDEEINDLAIDSGWTAEMVIVPSAIANTIPEGVEVADISIVDSKGRNQVVPSYNLPFLKTRTEDVYAKDPVTGKGKKTGQKVLAFVFQFGEQTIKTYSLMLNEAYKKGELERGTIVPFRADSCKAEHVPAKNGQPSYHFWQGATLEAGSEMMQDARVFIERRDAKFATLSKDAQARVIDLSADKQAEAFLAEFA